MTELELWGGVECTVNRTGADYLDQTRLSGHHDRLQDLDLFAGLGASALRYPVLWERVEPFGPGSADWSWPDERLSRLGELGIRPIVGLVHHGSGPRATSLLDPDFATKLSDYAGRVAARYPSVTDWTPINEPLTTARFSALYGHWYPHACDERSFWLALLGQIDATRMAMHAVRRVNPSARLIQTDDLGRTYATLPLAEQAAFNNFRRWAGWDLLFGRVLPPHPLWERLSRLGLAQRLHDIADDPCPPDIVGVNHYLTSDRFLDHRVQRYPDHRRGGAVAADYADIEAVRVLDPAPAGLAGALRETWQRYDTPIAITEVHNGCTREEQLRWAAQAWDTAVALRGEGMDLRAVTAWSLLGSHGWNTLLTSPGSYEPGVFDVSAGTPRPTALAALWTGLPAGAPRHPVAAGPGWWQRPHRLAYPLLSRPANASGTGRDARPTRLLICGATGTLGQAFARACVARGIPYRLATRSTLDLTRPRSIAATLEAERPWAVVNAAGWVRVDDAEHHERECHEANAVGAIALAERCDTLGIPCLSFSSDLVFDGSKREPYVESDTPSPLGAYGRSKAALEAGCMGLSTSLVVRTAAFFSADDPFNFAAAVVEQLGAGRRFIAADDEVITPTFVPQLVDAALDLLIDGAAGIWHLTNGEALSWVAFAERVAVACDLDVRLIDAVSGASLGRPALRPLYAALGSERGGALGPLTPTIARFAADRRARLVARAA